MPAIPDTAQLHDFLERKVSEYNRPEFVAEDPISVPHRFSLPADREIAGLFAALFAWGNRTTIIRKSLDLMERMDMAPAQFIRDHAAQERQQLIGFIHRTFRDDDLLFLVEFLQQHYREHVSLETAFTRWMQPGDKDVTNALNGFRRYVFAREHLRRSEKHISSPEQGSSCKRLNMFLRWMVRSDDAGVDFGIWKGITPAQLICPLDLHVARVARRLGLLQRPNADWKAAVELTDQLRRIDAADPVRYDFALFGLGVVEKF